jgi:MOSC domain-containing protein YiiM
MTASIVQLNVSDGGVPKLPVAVAEVTASGMSGDRQRNLKLHGGPTRALCLYSEERLEMLQAEGHPVVPGALGENVTIRGLEWEAIVPGTRLQLGTATVEITGYTAPCSNIEACFAGGDINRVNQKTNPGWSRVYASVKQPGTLRPGDPVAILSPGATA